MVKVELLQLLEINLESCDFLELFKSSREALLRKGFRSSTTAKITALGEVAHRYSSTPIPVRESINSSSSIAAIMSPILKHLSHEECSIILIHNHPSGNSKPGENDKVQTKLLKGAAELFDITLLDHVIIAGDSYFSLRMMG